jgi:hypothetical protein
MVSVLADQCRASYADIQIFQRVLLHQHLTTTNLQRLVSQIVSWIGSHQIICGPPYFWPMFALIGPLLGALFCFFRLSAFSSAS